MSHAWFELPHLQDGGLKRSELLFSEYLTAFHEDKAAAVLLERCQEFLRVGLPDDWDGAYTLTQK